MAAWALEEKTRLEPIKAADAAPRLACFRADLSGWITIITIYIIYNIVCVRKYGGKVNKDMAKLSVRGGFCLVIYITYWVNSYLRVTISKGIGVRLSGL